MVNFGSNLATMGLSLGIYVMYRRCVASKCAVHTSFLDCESPEIREQKEHRHKNLFKQAMMEFQVESIKHEGSGFYDKKHSEHHPVSGRHEELRGSEIPEQV